MFLVMEFLRNVFTNFIFEKLPRMKRAIRNNLDKQSHAALKEL